MMKSGLLFSLLCSAVFKVTTGQQTIPCTSSERGDINITGIETDLLIAGRLEICNGTQWLAVYDWSWGPHEARLVCEERGFPGSFACGRSCFGASTLESAFFRGCGGTPGEAAQEIIDCGISSDVYFPEFNAGVLCTHEDTLHKIKCPTCSTQTNDTHEITTLSSDSFRDAAEKSNSGIVAAIGAMCAILLLTLVGVVIGWVWSCHQNKSTSKQRNSRSAVNTLDNPTYCPTTPSIPSVQCISLGPRDTPTTGHTPTGQGQRAHHILSDPGTGGRWEEGVYHVLGEGYEVPIQSNRGRDERAGRAVEMAYSTLQHT